jgi:anthranilate synthase component 2
MDNILIIDNYDSFTYNLVQLVKKVSKKDVEVVSNDRFDLNNLTNYSHIILSPGPGLPDEAGLTKEVIRKYGPLKKILGVCLGLQAIGEVYGASLINLKQVYHGIKSTLKVVDPDDPVFENVSPIFESGRYHSWVINKKTLPEDLLITALDETGNIMAIRHRQYDVYGVQFHPESIMTPEGLVMMENFLSL